MTEQADNDQVEWDRREQAAEQRDMAIEGRVNALWEDKDAICRVIAENAEQLNAISNLCFDPEKTIREFIDKCFSDEAIEDLNL